MSRPITTVNAPDDCDWHAPDPAMLKARPALYTLFWAVPGASFSVGYATFERAMVAFAAAKATASVRHASVHHGERLIETYDYDPYRWHDVRLMVGR